MHGLVLDDNETDGHVSHHAGQEDQHVEQGDRDEQGQAHILRAQDLRMQKNGENQIMFFYLNKVRALSVCLASCSITLRYRTEYVTIFEPPNPTIVELFPV